VKFIQSLTESRLLSSDSAYRKFTAKTVSELAVLHICALRIISSEMRSHNWGEDYAQRSTKMLHFARFYTSTTDLSLLVYALLNSENIEFHDPHGSNDHLEAVHIHEPLLTKWIKEIARGAMSENTTRTLFTKLDKEFNIKSSTVRAIRRLVQDWPRLNREEKNLSMNRLLQILHSKAPTSDILHKLDDLAHHLGLKDIEKEEEKKKKNGSMIAGLMAFGGGYLLARKLGEEAQPEAAPLAEDDCGGTTCSDGIASFVKPLGMPVQRRSSPCPKKRKARRKKSK
jgi:hypothetical protein